MNEKRGLKIGSFECMKSLPFILCLLLKKSLTPSLKGSEYKIATWDRK